MFKELRTTERCCTWNRELNFIVSIETEMAQFLRQRELFRRRGRIPVPSRYLEGFVCNEFDEIVTNREHHNALGDSPPLSCRFSKWIRGGAFMATADELGVLNLYDIRRPLRTASEGSWEAHNNAVFDIAWMPVDGEAKLITASGDQKIRLWDCSNTQSPLATFAGHSGSVKSVSFCPEEPMVFASGARDGHVMLWDLRVNRSAGSPPYQIKPCSQLFNAHNSFGMAASTTARAFLKRPHRGQVETAGRQSVTAVLFRDDRCIVSAGGGDGMIKVWDIRMPRSIHQLVPTPAATFSYCGERQGRHGFTGLIMDPTKATVFASCTDDVVYRYDIAACNPKPVSSIQAQGLASYFVKMDLSPDGQFLVTGSTENDAVIYQVDHPDQPRVALTGHAGEVMGVAFCPGHQDQLVTCSDDCSVRVWRRKNATHLSTDRCRGRRVGEARPVAAPQRAVSETASGGGRESGQVTPSRDKCMRTSSMLNFVKVTPSRLPLFEDKENIVEYAESAAVRSPPPAKRAYAPPSPSRSAGQASSVQLCCGDATSGVAAVRPSAPTTPVSSAATSLSFATPTSSRSKLSPNPSTSTGAKAKSLSSSSASKAGTPKLTSLQQWLSPRPQPPLSTGKPVSSSSSPPTSPRSASALQNRTNQLQVTPGGSPKRRLSHADKGGGGLVRAAPENATTAGAAAISTGGTPTTSCRQNLLAQAGVSASPESVPLQTATSRMATAE